MERLKKFCDVEERCIVLLESISQFKDTSVESLIFNHIQCHFNLSQIGKCTVLKEESPIHYERGELQEIIIYSILSLLVICILMRLYLYDILRLSRIG